MVITNGTQLNIYSILFDIITSDATLSRKFNSRNIYEFEDTKPKATNNKSPFPYIVIKVPLYDITERVVVTNTTQIKTFNVPILMVIEWKAKDKAREYSNALINAVEQNQSKFTDAGYNKPIIPSEGIDPETISGAEVVTARFNLQVNGQVVI